MIESFDMAIAQALFAARSSAGVDIFSLVTELGGALAVVAVMICAFLLFWKGKRWAYALGLMFSLGGGLTTSYILKNLIGRARPPVEMQAILETSYSFPSNHATAAMALYGFLAFTLWKLSPKYRVAGILLLSLIILLVGFSRLYLGVHYPTDVLAGFLLGALFAWLGSLVTRKLEWM